MLERIPERFRTSAVARAVASPSGIVLSGAFAAAAIASGLPIVVAPLAAALGWATRIAFALPGKSNDDEIDPFRLQEPWRRFVRDAMASKARFDKTLAECRPGPLQDRLAEVGVRIGDGVRECWRIAQHGNSLQDGLSRLQGHNIRQHLEQIRSEQQRAGEDSDTRATLARTEEAIAAQLASYERMNELAQDVHNRLRLLDAQLDEAVVRAIELSVHQGDAGALNPLSVDVNNLVSELENLRQALDETRQGPSSDVLRAEP